MPRASLRLANRAAKRSEGGGSRSLPLPLGVRVLVDPLYDADNIGSIIIPDVAKNPMSQQGDVVAVGPEQEDIEVGERVLYRPFMGKKVPWDGYEYLMYEPQHIVGWLAPDGELFPLPDYVMVLPDWTERKGSLFIPKVTFEVEPRIRGRVRRRGARVTEVEVGQEILYPRMAGYEVGLKTTVWYLIHKDDVLGVLK